MNNILVSVCMITYKHEEFIKHAIAGVLMQETDFEVELIIADDCSPDKTQQIVESFKNHPNYNWIKYKKHLKNKGMMNNFVWSLRECKGQFIALCEGDDYWVNSNKLQKQYDFLIYNTSYSIVSHNSIRYELNGEFKSMNNLIENIDFSISDIINGVVTIPTSSIFFRNKNQIPAWLNDCTVGDWPLLIYLLNNSKGYFIIDNMSVYRKHYGGISYLIANGNNSQILLNTFLIINKQISSQVIKGHISKLYFNSFLYFLRNDKLVVELFLKSIFYNPSNLINYSKGALKNVLRTYLFCK